MILRKLIILLFLSLASCGFVERIFAPVSLDEAFPDKDIQNFIKCVDYNENEIGKKCTLSRDKLNSKGWGDFTPFLWLVRYYNLSPDGTKKMIQYGANPHIFSRWSASTVAGHVTRDAMLEHLKAMVDAGMDVNYYDGKIGKISILEVAITHWDDAIMQYLMDQKVNLERRNLRGETAILDVSYIVHSGGPFKKHIFLLDHGADPTVVDNRGKGICHHIERDNFTNWDDDPKLPNYRKILGKRLEDEYGIICKESEYFKPDWRN